MENIQQLSYDMLSNVGEAKSYFIEAMKLARQGNFVEAEQSLVKGEEFFLEGHKAHMKMIEEHKAETGISLVVAHAEDQLMATDTIKIMAAEIIEVYKAILKKEDKA